MLRNLSTRARVALGALVVALVGGGGLVAANAATAAGPVLSTTERGLCIKQGTGEPRSLWLVAATHKCPDPYWGPASLEDAFGIELPKAAESPVVIKQESIKLTPDRKSGTVVVKDLPGYAGVKSPEAFGYTTTDLPTGVAVTVAANPAPKSGDKVRSFTVESTGTIPADQSVTVTVWVINAKLTPAS
jgi:hypothetical protein